MSVLNNHSLSYYFSFFVQIFVFVIGSYYFSTSVFGWIQRKERNTGDTQPANVFALVIPSHNEEKVIGHMVESLKKLNYPEELYDIFVIADNCSDSTAAIAREKGAIVYERFNDVEKGKGYALEWMFNKIFAMEKKYDAIAVFDADNIVSNNFLLEMDKQFKKGHKVVQGYIDSKNPFDSWITCCYSIAFWTINRLFQLARYNLNLCCMLSGTGFAISTDVLKKLGWGATCLTEDMEFTMKLALNNYKVSWAHNAIVYDEKPLTLSQSWLQRKRWMQGHADVASRYFKPLVLKAIKEGDIVALDCAIYLLQPLRIIAVGIIMSLALLQNFYPHGKLGVFYIRYLFPNAIIWDLFVIAQFIYAPFAMALEKKLNFKVMLGYLIYPYYGLTWIPITIHGILDKNKKEWFHTKHTRQISISELEKA
ncbi:MAG: hypothetical protein PWR27_451 [Petroclostridium sp.]|jgi:cellulose synthase/poly-beta-1,6-N-acetylglucosamine synthase-like glycosyltransferase|nr:glycosyl transferase family 2 [Clostridia bacterium]MDK2809742.1 hypothetical protein [Petroclostridium sp.]